ncbi:alpha/beta-hydrolase [Mollisia scopiformis]|uniref:Alpha/beta-hydrolase n=1 Tax=Mollisia scopiformis TaxID=149040 RepID=A0A194XJ03_MOLSC|nr:alpha/beta-hydrolase [Mollisia scopiformis]KUJ20099.1 alpha/beta-hydrolase [Mollisia scopiformis]
MTIQTIHYQVPSLSAELIGELDDDLTLFRGIPYATVTKRWTHSEVLNTLESPFDATTFGPRCIQIESPSVAVGGNLHGNPYDHEFGCLNLNITVPTKTLESPSNNLFPLLPVMVWIHGGAFLHGSNSRPRDRPERLCRLALSNGTPIILVSIQYRVGALGFAASLDLATESHRNQHPSHLPSSGNYGLIDQRSALLWIQSHIQGFGGDPNNVTTFGISAGSASIHYHILSGDPLFDRAIMMSGSAPVLGPLPATMFGQAWKEMCTSLNISHFGLEAKLEKLRSLDAMEILKHYTRAPMGPMACGIYLPLNWDVFAKQPETRCKSIILGDTKCDGIIVDYISTHVPQPRFLHDLSGVFHSPADIDTFLVYFGIRKEEMSYEKYREALRFFFSVMLFQYPNLCIARGFGGKAYLYHFDQPSTLEGETEGLSYHGMCATYMFQNENDGLPEEHVKTAEEMGKIWTAFASGKSKPWEEFGKKERFMRFGPGASAVTEVKGDGERDYIYLEWLESHREETRSLFTFASENVECKLLKQDCSSALSSESARM